MFGFEIIGQCYFVLPSHSCPPEKFLLTNHNYVAMCVLFQNDKIDPTSNFMLLFFHSMTNTGSFLNAGVSK